MRWYHKIVTWINVIVSTVASLLCVFMMSCWIARCFIVSFGADFCTWNFCAIFLWRIFDWRILDWRFPECDLRLLWGKWVFSSPAHVVSSNGKNKCNSKRRHIWGLQYIDSVLSDRSGVLIRWPYGEGRKQTSVTSTFHSVKDCAKRTH